jgi:integrase
MRKKRANGEGYFFPRGRGWAGQIRVPDPAFGRSKRVYVRGRSRAEVVRLAEEARKAHLVAQDYRITVSEWLDHWYDTYVASLRMNTRMTYESVIRCHIVPAIGAVQLFKLTPEHVVSMLSDTRRAPKTRQLIRNVLSRALKQAMQVGKVIRNVVQAIPPIRVERKDRRVFSKDELAVFLRVAKESRYWPAYLLMATTGIRRGEALALRWSDISLEKKTITIRQTLVKTRRGLITNPPKTKLSKRSIRLPEFAVEALSEIPARMRHGLVTSTTTGEMIDPDLLWSDYRRMLRSAGLPRVTLHDLRHTHASILLQCGVGITDVSKRLGHSTIKTTADMYAHEVPGEADSAALKMNEIISQ